LNEIEYFNWCVGQPYNVVLAVHARGDLTPDRLRAALDKVQARHPLLRANTEIGRGGLPWFSSDGVGTIPIAVIEGAEPEEARRLAVRELDSTFDRDGGASPRPPLMRVSLVRPLDRTQPIALVLTAQHVIADGLSMVFVFRDLLHFIDEPDSPVTVLDAPALADDLLPPAVRRGIPTSPLRCRLALALLTIYAWLRFGRRRQPPARRAQHHLSWTLTPDETDRLRARCRRARVSIQSAICTAFLSGFSAIHTPVSLRPYLARPVGESVGMFVGAANVRMGLTASRGFWDNARRYHRRLRRALRNPFAIFRTFSKAVPVAEVKRFGELIVRILSKQRPIGITNLGVLDGEALQLRGRTLTVESFFGGTTSIMNASVLMVYTIDGRMNLHLLASERDEADSSVRDDCARAVRTLLAASR